MKQDADILSSIGCVYDLAPVPSAHTSRPEWPPGVTDVEHPLGKPCCLSKAWCEAQPAGVVNGGCRLLGRRHGGRVRMSRGAATNAHGQLSSAADGENARAYRPGNDPGSGRYGRGGSAPGGAGAPLDIFRTAIAGAGRAASAARPSLNTAAARQTSDSLSGSACADANRLTWDCRDRVRTRVNADVPPDARTDSWRGVPGHPGVGILRTVTQIAPSSVDLPREVGKFTRKIADVALNSESVPHGTVQSTECDPSPRLPSVPPDDHGLRCRGSHFACITATLEPDHAPLR